MILRNKAKIRKQLLALMVEWFENKNTQQLMIGLKEENYKDKDYYILLTSAFFHRHGPLIDALVKQYDFLQEHQATLYIYRFIEEEEFRNKEIKRYYDTKK